MQILQLQILIPSAAVSSHKPGYKVRWIIYFPCVDNLFHCTAVWRTTWRTVRPVKTNRSFSTVVSLLRLLRRRQSLRIRQDHQTRTSWLLRHRHPGTLCPSYVNPLALDKQWPPSVSSFYKENNFKPCSTKQLLNMFKLWREQASVSHVSVRRFANYCIQNSPINSKM